MMAENLQKRPKKGILKNSSSFDKPVPVQRTRGSKETKWDEMNIIATYHPPDKDYGHMKVDEPKTPFSYDIADQDEVDGLDAKELAEKIRIASEAPPKVLESQNDSDNESDDEDMSEEAREKRKAFLQKRKKHYNEFQAIQLAKQLMAEEDDDEDGSDIASSSK